VQRIVTTAVLLIAAAGAASPSRAQTSAAQPAFDVASVKPNASGDWRKSLGPAPGGRFLATNQTLRDLLPFAYGLPQMAAGIRIVGGPSWIDADRFVIVARAEGTPSPEQLGGTLVMSRAGGALGTRLRRSEVSGEACAARRAAIRRREPVPPQEPGKPPVCGSGRTVPGRITAVGWSMEQLVNALMPFAGRVVLDRTGRVGLFDADFEWAPDQIPRPQPDDPDPPRIDPNGPSLFTALQEQLGLKLDSARGPVDVLVVDNVAKPTED